MGLVLNHQACSATAALWQVPASRLPHLLLNVPPSPKTALSPNPKFLSIRRKFCKLSVQDVPLSSLNKLCNHDLRCLYHRSCHPDFCIVRAACPSQFEQKLQHQTVALCTSERDLEIYSGNIIFRAIKIKTRCLSTTPEADMAKYL